jgi:protein gp37
VETLMGDKTSIEWTEATWNPIRGCSRVSEGCRNCYAERTAVRQSGEGGAYKGLVRSTINGPRWTGEVRFVEEALDLPLRWKAPRRIFVNSMSDLFHENVSVEWMNRIFAVMEASPRHTFQVLTKRARRMEIYVRQRWLRTRPPNIQLGVSVEDQPAADERIPLLLQTPAAVRWVSYEPALAAVDFEPYLWRRLPLDRVSGRALNDAPSAEHGVRLLDWVVVGGESGPGARPFDLAWARSTIAQCRAAGVPVFVKQLGAFPVDCAGGGPFRPQITPHEHPPGTGGDECRVILRDRKGGDIEEWTVAIADLAVREYPR